MRRFLLRISYEGGGFSGSARQIGRRTVQGELEAALRRLGERSETLFASRTDAGVHALDAPVAVDLHKRWTPHRIVAALNAHLPTDIRVINACEVPSHYNPRRSAFKKRYVYAVFMGTTPALFVRFVHTIRNQLNVDLMRMAARNLVGTHNLSGVLVSANKRTVWTLDRFKVEEVRVPYGNLVLFCLEARAFGYKMVRSLCGLMVDVGSGRIGPEEVVDVGAGRISWRRLVLPPQGLCLVRVELEGIECGWRSSRTSTLIFPPCRLFLKT